MKQALKRPPQSERASDDVQCNGVTQSAQPISSWQQWLLSADPRPLLLLSLVCAVWYFWEFRLPMAAMSRPAYYVAACLGIMFLSILVGLRALQLRWSKQWASRYKINHRTSRSRRRFWPWLLGIAIATYILLVYRVPIQLSFLLSRPALDRLADEALANPRVADTMVSAGLYRVAGGRVIERTVVIYLGKDGGDYGFARVPTAAADLIFHRPGAEAKPGYCADFPRQDLGDVVGERMAGDWFVMYSAHWRENLQRR